MSEIVRVVDLQKTYQLGRTEVYALRGVNLSVEEGEFLAIVGPSGSGKTTLLNLIGCLDEPSSGKIFIKDRDVSHLDDAKATKLRLYTIGFIFQSFNLIPVLSVYENVEFPLLLQGRSPKARQEMIHKILDAVGLVNYAHHKPDELSGGQRQRVAIARALVSEPHIVLADEPTANLDSDTGNTIIELMLKLNRELKTTFIFSTHDPKIMTRAGRKVVLKDGAIEQAS